MLLQSKKVTILHFFIWSCEVPMPPDKTTPKTSSDKSSIDREDHKKVQPSIASMNDKVAGDIACRVHPSVEMWSLEMRAAGIFPEVQFIALTPGR
jgi:hypothetical protein